MTVNEQNRRGVFSQIGETAVQALLGMSHPVHLTPQSMAKGLRATFYPVISATERVSRFAEDLRNALAGHGVTLLSYEEALADRQTGKLQENLVIIAPGELSTGDLPVDHVRNLRTVVIVGIVDGPCPADNEPGLQEKLNSVVKVLAWNILQVVVFVDEDSWTVCTMNGAIVRLNRDASFDERVLSILIPKLAAPVVPPHSSDFELREGELDVTANGCALFARDFTESGKTWGRTGLMLFHTSLESLAYRNRYYQRIAAAYLDHRSGMSYGFLARQMPVPVVPAMTIREADESLGPYDWRGIGYRWLQDQLHVLVHVPGGPCVVPVPDVWVLTTRSGCDKSNVDIHRDIVLMGLSAGRIVIETPQGVSARVDCKPSYDTLTILAHASGNAIVASLLARLQPGATFSEMLRSSGAALVHWHGLINPSILPRGYVVHGNTNPPVSCSTLQSAIYALTGKLAALAGSLEAGTPFLGDVHVEPFHGTNVTWRSLAHLGQWVLQNIASSGITQFSVQQVESRDHVEISLPPGS